MHELLDDDEFDAHFFDAGDDPSFRPGTPKAGDGRSGVTVRPRAVLPGCTDLRQLSLARLMLAQEVRLAQSDVIADARTGFSNAPVPSLTPAPDPAPEDQAMAWDAASHEDDFDLWDELARPSNRKSLRSMV